MLLEALAKFMDESEGEHIASTERRDVLQGQPCPPHDMSFARTSIEYRKTEGAGSGRIFEVNELSTTD